MHIPSTSTLNVANNKFEPLKIQGSDRIKAYVKQDKGPFEKRIDGVSCRLSIMVSSKYGHNDLPPATL